MCGDGLHIEEGRVQMTNTITGMNSSIALGAYPTRKTWKQATTTEQKKNGSYYTTWQ
jgi:hypothetical protein